MPAFLKRRVSELPRHSRPAFGRRGKWQFLISPSTYGLETHGCFLDYQPGLAAHLAAGTASGWERCCGAAPWLPLIFCP